MATELRRRNETQYTYRPVEYSSKCVLLLLVYVIYAIKHKLFFCSRQTFISFVTLPLLLYYCKSSCLINYLNILLDIYSLSSNYAAFWTFFFKVYRNKMTLEVWYCLN
jgi:hypothetical protein